MELEISIRVITKFNRLIEIENDWNRELKNSAENPFLYSRLLSEFMQFWEAAGWTSLVVIFLSDDKIIGMVPLRILKRFHLIYVSTLAHDIYSDFYLHDKYREICITQLIDFLFKHLKCHAITMTLQDSSSNLRVLTKICQKKGLYFWKTPFTGRAIIPVENDWDVFYRSLKVKVRKEFRRIKRKLDNLGSWQISCVGVDSNSIERILAVERMNWKTKLRAQNKVQEDRPLRIILRASQQKGEIEPIYEAKVWFLEVEGQAIAYLLVMLYKGTAIFVKTSYDARFKEISPGRFLMNATIREMYRKGNVKKIDFISDLPVVQIWKPLCENRTKVNIKRNIHLSTFLRFAGENPLISKFVELAKKI